MKPLFLKGVRWGVVGWWPPWKKPPGGTAEPAEDFPAFSPTQTDGKNARNFSLDAEKTDSTHALVCFLFSSGGFKCVSISTLLGNLTIFFNWYGWNDLNYPPGFCVSGSTFSTAAETSLRSLQLVSPVGCKNGILTSFLIWVVVSNIFYVQPYLGAWGNDPIWRAYFSKGLVQPPTSYEIIPEKKIGRKFSSLHVFCRQKKNQGQLIPGNNGVATKTTG